MGSFEAVGLNATTIQLVWSTPKSLFDHLEISCFLNETDSVRNVLNKSESNVQLTRYVLHELIPGASYTCGITAIRKPRHGLVKASSTTTATASTSKYLNL